MRAAAVPQQIKDLWVIDGPNSRRPLPGHHESQKEQDIFCMSWMAQMIIFGARVSGGESVIWNGHGETGRRGKFTG